MPGEVQTFARTLIEIHDIVRSSVSAITGHFIGYHAPDMTDNKQEKLKNFVFPKETATTVKCHHARHQLQQS